MSTPSAPRRQARLRPRPSLRAVALSLLPLAALASGCGGTSPALSPQQIVARSAKKTSAITSFHLSVDIEHVPAPASGLSLTFADGDVVVPDRLHARVGGTFQGVPLTSELTVIGNRHYLKNPLTGKWQVVSISLSPVAFFDPTKGVLGVITGAKDLAGDGSEDVGGVSCYRLTGKVPGTALGPLLGTRGTAKLVPVQLWIGKSDLLLRRIRVSGPIAAGEGKDAVRTVELSAFGEHVKISAPPVSP